MAKKHNPFKEEFVERRLGEWESRGQSTWHWKNYMVKKKRGGGYYLLRDGVHWITTHSVEGAKRHAIIDRLDF